MPSTGPQAQKRKRDMSLKQKHRNLRTKTKVPCPNKITSTMQQKYRNPKIAEVVAIWPQRGIAPYPPTYYTPTT